MSIENFLYSLMKFFESITAVDVNPESMKDAFFKYIINTYLKYISMPFYRLTPWETPENLANIVGKEYGFADGIEPTKGIVRLGQDVLKDEQFKRHPKLKDLKAIIDFISGCFSRIPNRAKIAESLSWLGKRYDIKDILDKKGVYSSMILEIIKVVRISTPSV